MGQPSRLSSRASYAFSASVVFVAQTASLSVSPEIVAAREDFFNHGWTRINTDEDGFSLIRVHPCSSVVGSYWLRLRRAALYRRMPSCRTAPCPGRRNPAKGLPICNRRYSRLAICATLNGYRASRPRRILGRDAPAAGGTPAPLPRGSWRESIGRCDCLGKHFAVQTRVRSGTQRIGLGILLCVLGALRVRVSTCFARSQPNLTWLQQVSELKASSLWRAS